MVNIKSQDDSHLELTIATTLLRDFQTSLNEVLTPRAAKLTAAKLKSRVSREGMGFLTKTLPRLCKALDQCLANQRTMNSTELGFKPQPGSKLPMFMGELFNRVLAKDGKVLQVPCVTCIRMIRQLCYLFYKYELPYSVDDEEKVIDNFRKTEVDLVHVDDLLSKVAEMIDCKPEGYKSLTPEAGRIIRRARRYLHQVFANFDCDDIQPRHGPGTVSTRERLWEKYTWKDIPSRLSAIYPIDAYFYASPGHVCDSISEIKSLGDCEDSAQVCLVPKDSRGPRLISCEPLVFQWMQQGLAQAVMRHVESHPLTRDAVHFTDQQPNQFAALLGSRTGRYATLDLKDASDRVTCGLVRLLFPEPLQERLLALRSLSTVLPDKQKLKLRKFAPMGSALCFPVMALTIWALLRAGLTDAYSRERILVYGDDVVVPTAQAATAMRILESFGLLINRDKSCTSGLFRESCGVDAFSGVNVTPVRIRTVWSPSQSPEAYASWIAYANSMYRGKYHHTYDVIVGELLALYGSIPTKEQVFNSCPSLYEVPETCRRPKSRTNVHLQKREYRVRDVVSVPIVREVSGWKMLLRYFANTSPSIDLPERDRLATGVAQKDASPPFSVRVYTKRHSSLLEWCWR
jgi:hypothetical protein